MKDLRGTRAEKNILTAFAGESQAHNRYSYFSKKARKEGFGQISAVFEETAAHEKVHAKRLFEFLQGGDVEIRAAFPAGIIGTTAENLKASAAGEHYEHSEMYPTFAAVAREEGFEEVARLLEAIAVAERLHERRFLSLLTNVENGTVFKKSGSEVWYCRKCGYIHEGEEAPKGCPACAHPRSHFEILARNW